VLGDGYCLGHIPSLSVVLEGTAQGICCRRQLVRVEGGHLSAAQAKQERRRLGVPSRFRTGRRDPFSRHPPLEVGERLLIGVDCQRLLPGQQGIMHQPLGA
jgi:hypothetical protein